MSGVLRLEMRLEPGKGGGIAGSRFSTLEGFKTVESGQCRMWCWARERVLKGVLGADSRKVRLRGGRCGFGDFVLYGRNNSLLGYRTLLDFRMSGQCIGEILAVMPLAVIVCD